jgi:hypothetical protein
MPLPSLRVGFPLLSTDRFTIIFGDRVFCLPLGRSGREEDSREEKAEASGGTGQAGGRPILILAGGFISSKFLQLHDYAASGVQLVSAPFSHRHHLID